MARVTVEDCIEKVDNRFELILIAAHRARTISAGSPIMVERDNDKNPVVALREIAEDVIKPGDLKEEFIHSLQKYVEVDEPEPQITPAATGARVPLLLGRDDKSQDTEIDQMQMSEEELLKGMKSMAAPDVNPRTRSR